jgi:hypothetical protein
VAEPLPVIVRAAETVEGRSRLYRRGRARDTAAAALRSGARARLAGPLGLGGEPAPEALAAAVASRAGRPVAVAGGLLYGPAPADDPALVRLATDLDELVRTTLTREGRRA